MAAPDKEEPGDLLALTPADRRSTGPDGMVIVLGLVHDLIQDAIVAKIGYSNCTCRGAAPHPGLLRAQLLDL